MGALSVRELNANVSSAIARVQSGETIDILKNGKVVAEIRPKFEARNAEWQKARKESIDMMRKGLNLGIGKVTLEDKYGEDA